MAFMAQYDGHCAAACGDPIEEGDLVDYYEDELMHTECATAKSGVNDFDDYLDDNGRLPRPVPTCDTCWMQMPCLCEED